MKLKNSFLLLLLLCGIPSTSQGATKLLLARTSSGVDHTYGGNPIMRMPQVNSIVVVIDGTELTLPYNTEGVSITMYKNGVKAYTVDVPVGITQVTFQEELETYSTMLIQYGSDVYGVDL